MRKTIHILGKSVVTVAILYGNLSKLTAQDRPEAPVLKSNTISEVPATNSVADKKADGSTDATLGAKPQEAASSRDEWVKQTRRVLDIAVEPRMSSEQNAAISKELSTLKPKDGGDPRLLFAFVMVSLFEKQWIEAQKQAVDLLKNSPDYIPARVANARMLMMRDQRLPALAELELLAKGLNSPASIVTQDQLVAAASFLGLAVGYFEGPGKDSVKATNLSALLVAAKNIPVPLQETFSTSRELVAQEYQVVLEKGEEALKQSRETSQQKAEQLRAELESTREQTQKNAEAAKQRLESSFSQANSAWNIAWSQSQAISRIISNLQGQQSQLITSISLLRPPRVDENGNVDRNDELRYLGEKQRLENLIFNLDTQLNQQSIQHDFARQSGIAAENRMNAIRAEGQRLGMSWAAQNGSFAKMDQMIRGKEQAAKKAEAKTSSSKARQARSFNTYDDFNFYKEQSLLLESLPST